VDSLRPVLSTWEDILAQLRCTSVSWRGNSLSEGDRDTYTEAIVLCALHLIDMSTRFGGIGPHRELVAWARFACTLDVLDVGEFLSDAVTLLRHVSEPTTYSWFKRQLAEKYPFTGRFLAPIRLALTEFLSNPSAEAFTPCYQFLSFLTHVSLRDLPVDLEPEYVELESILQTQTYPPAIVREMNLIMREWLAEFSVNPDSLNPHHGPGAVAEAAATQLDKYRFLGTDAMLDYVLSHHAGVVPTSYYAYPPSNWKRESVFVDVPKSMKTRRGISKEPATLMFWQQAIKDCIVDYVHRHPELSKHINFDDQSRNARLAISGSRSGRFATIDLSSASDTVTTTLVKAVFEGTPLYPFLVGLRSRTVRLPSGKVLRVEKYAPMGSALCFPVETLIFSCAIEYAVRRARRQGLGFYPSWRVFGDDIIVRTPLFEEVVMVLEGLNFKINHSKSFSSCARFRESCGGEGYDGVDVTPMRISRRFYSVRGRITSRHAEITTGLMDMANRCHAYGFSLTRAWIIRVLLDNPIAPPLFSEDGRGALYSPMPDNYRAKRRVNYDWQREEIQVLVSRPVVQNRTTASDLEAARYVETLRLLQFRKGDVFYPEDSIQVQCGTRRTKLSKTWVPSTRSSFACLGLIKPLQPE